MGSKKYIDFDNLPGMVQPEVVVEKGNDTAEEKKDDGAFEILDLDF